MSSCFKPEKISKHGERSQKEKEKQTVLQLLCFLKPGTRGMLNAFAFSTELNVKSVKGVHTAWGK